MVFVSTHVPLCTKPLTCGVVAQAVGNPVPRVPHPDWLLKRLSAATDARKQRRISSMFAAKAPKRCGGCGGDGGGGSDGDMEDLGVAQPAAAAGRGRAVARKKQRQIQLRTIVRRPSAMLPLCAALLGRRRPFGTPASHCRQGVTRHPPPSQARNRRVQIVSVVLGW